MNKIIAICGLKGSGKDTVGDYIVKKYNGWEKKSFAGKLKDITSILFGWDRTMLAGETSDARKQREEPCEFWSKKLGKPFSPRQALQFIGTELFRNQFLPSIWVDCLERELLTTDKNIVITDVRFQNEIEMIKSLGGTIIRVERNLPNWFREVEQLRKDGLTIEKIKEIVPDIKNIHDSELDWIGVDNPSMIIDNNGSFEDLYKNIEYISEIS